jgi:hypothetical protein
MMNKVSKESGTALPSKSKLSTNRTEGNLRRPQRLQSLSVARTKSDETSRHILEC